MVSSYGGEPLWARSLSLLVELFGLTWRGLYTYFPFYWPHFGVSIQYQSARDERMQAHTYKRDYGMESVPVKTEGWGGYEREFREEICQF